MEGTSTYSRLRTTAVAALVAAGLVLAAMSAPANALTHARDISTGIRNSSQVPIKVQICPNGHVSIHYQFGTQANPCSTVTETYTVLPGDRHIVFNTNPLGIIISAKGKTLYFYAKNPIIGLPFFEANGSKVALDAPETRERTVDGVHVRFRRWVDEPRHGETVKLMSLEMVDWP